jgi:hypothetical protein
MLDGCAGFRPLGPHLVPRLVALPLSFSGGDLAI